MRAYKTINESYIEPISFTVPRRAETFQADIFPPAVGLKPAVTAQEWLDGKTDLPSKIDLESVYDGNAPKEVPSDYKPPTQAPAPVEKPAPKAEPKPAPAATRAPPPSVNDQKGSIAAMASKYQDNEASSADEEEEASSNFEEIGRPAPRNNVPIRSEAPKPSPPINQKPVPAAAKPSAPLKSPTITTSPAAAAAPASSSFPSSINAGTSLDQIKQLIENQTKVITAQNDQIGHLSTEIEALKRKVSSGSQDQSERIRQLELELEEARS